MLYLNLKFAKSPRPGADRAQIVLKGYFDDHENDVCLGGKCANYWDVERDVNFLKSELDRILAKARNRFLGEPE